MPNEIQSYRGAVEPSAFTPTSSDIKLWRGAIEPAGFVDLLADNVQMATTVSAPTLTINPSLFSMTIDLAGLYDTTIELDGDVG